MSGRIHIVIEEEPRNGNPTIAVFEENGETPRRVEEIWKLIQPTLEGRYTPVKSFGKPVHGGKKA